MTTRPGARDALTLGDPRRQSPASSGTVVRRRRLGRLGDRPPRIRPARWRLSKQSLFVARTTGGPFVETATSVLADLFIMFLAAKVAGEIFERLRQPAVIGELLVGVI